MPLRFPSVYARISVLWRASERKTCFARIGIERASVTAIENDYGFDLVFARQLEALGNRGDVGVGISTSANSRHAARAVEIARLKSIYAVALTGASGGLLKKIARFAFLQKKLREFKSATSSRATLSARL